MAVKIGIGVVLEELHGNPILRQALPILTRLAGAVSANVRADAAHYLGLTQAAEATPRYAGYSMTRTRMSGKSPLNPSPSSILQTETIHEQTATDTLRTRRLHQ